MDKSLVRKNIGDSVFFNYFTDKKFKHNQLSVNFIMPLSIETASNNSMVPLILRKGSKNFPDFSALNAQLNRLYGASLNVNISRFNRYQYIDISIHFLDNRYALHNENLVELCSKLIIDLIFNPNLENGVFPLKDVNLERQYLIDTIEAEINDKRSYALFRTIEEMYRAEPISVPKYGTIETAMATNPESITQAWKDMLSSSVVEIIFTGSGDPSSALLLFEDSFSKIPRNPIGYSLLKLDDIATKVTEVNEPMENLQQEKLVMGMRVKGLETTEQKDAARLFSSMYGATPFSKLFLNVREKLSLCYYCSSRIDTVNNFLLVDSGVESENVEKAKLEIMNQLKSIQNGEITDEELINTKLLLANAIKNTNDSLSGIESWYMSQILKGKNISPEQDIENINKITKEQIIEIAKGVTLDTVYLLAGKENS